MKMVNKVRLVYCIVLKAKASYNWGFFSIENAEIRYGWGFSLMKTIK